MSTPQPEPRLYKNILGSIAFAFFLWVFGGINIEFRIMFTAYVFLAVSCIGWILWLCKVLKPRVVIAIQAAVFPAMLVVWICVGIYEARREKAVIPTTEYSEYFPRMLFPEDRRYVTLLEKPTFTLSGDLPGIDGATSLRDLYYPLTTTAFSGTTYPHMNCSRTPEAYESLISGKPDWYSKKSVDMIFVFRPSRQQIEEAAAAGKELKITPIGYDAFVFFVNAANPVNNLTTEQLRDIYSGRVTNWRELNGEDKRILPFQRYEGSGSQGGMERFMEDDTLMEPEREHRFRFMMGIIEHTERYRNLESAIGYSFLYYVETMLKGGGVKLLGVNGVQPSKETIQDGSYPMIEEICIVTAGTQNPQVQEFIDWILSPQGQAMVEAVGYVPVNPATPEQPFPATKVDRY